MKALLIDDHAFFRSGMVHYLESLQEQYTVLEAQDTSQALNLLEQQQDIGLILLDVQLEHENGLEIMPRLVAMAPQIPIVIISGSTDAAWIRLSIKLGARGCISKSASPREIANAIKFVLSGNTYLPKLALETLESKSLEIRSSTKGVSPKLTPRQKSVLECVSTGASNIEVADILGISETTVRAHMTNIFKALSVHNRTRAVSVAQQHGLIQVVSERS
jgi:DNA-binding NarL/FixJ family response regulator